MKEAVAVGYKIKTAKMRIAVPFKVDQGAGLRAEYTSLKNSSREPLEMNFVSIWNSRRSDPILLITVDSLYPGKRLREMVETAVPHLESSRIFLAASHTHQAPMLDETKPYLGHVSEEFLSTLAAQIQSIVVDLVSPQERKSANLKVGTSSGNFSVNRRRRARVSIGSSGLLLNRILLAPNLKGPVDETIIVGGFFDEDDAPLCILWNYACHPVAHPHPQVFSGHYPDAVRSRLREDYRVPDLPVLFFQGFSGNTRPSASIGVSGLKEFARFCVSGPRFRKMKPRVYAQWIGSLSSFVSDIPLHKVLGPNTLDARRLSEPGDLFINELERPVSFHHVQISEDLSLVGVSAEVVCEYSSLVRDLSPSKNVMCIGCIDDSFGYIPTERMISEGGYESGEYCKQFSLGPISELIEINFISILRRLLSRSQSEQ